MEKQEALGVDIGNVIIEFRYVDKNDQVLFEEGYSTIPATDGVVESLRKLNDEKFHGNILLISRATEWAQAKIRQWLLDNDFYTKTGIAPEQVFFCAERHEKEALCAANNVTYFVDDRLEVLGHLVGKVPHLFLYHPDQEEIDQFAEYLPDVMRLENWKAVTEAILKTA